MSVAGTYTTTKATGARIPSVAVQLCAVSTWWPRSMVRLATTTVSRKAAKRTKGHRLRRRSTGSRRAATSPAGGADTSGLRRGVGERLDSDRPALALVDRRGPDRGVVLAQAPVGQEPRVLVAPELHVDQVLGARGQRPAADPPAGGLPHLVLENAQAAPHQGFRHARPLGRIDEAEEDQVAQQHAPVAAEAPGQAIPVERLRAGVDEMGDVGAVVALSLHHEGLRPDRL